MFKKEFDWVLKEKYGGRLDKRIKADMGRIIKGEPIDYVIGFRNFLGCKIDLSYRPLVPRVETEFWADKMIEEIRKAKKGPIKCLDLFSGSGCIGIAASKHLKNSKVDFAEIEKKFLKQISKNLQLNNISLRRIKLIQTDVFRNIRNRYDYIFANPPYIAEKRKNEVQPEVLKYEPRKSIFAGKDGLFYIKKLLEQGGKYLKENGKMYIEFSPEQKKKIEELLGQNRWQNYQFYKDQYKRWRYFKVW